MSQSDILYKIHDDLELLKRDVAEIKEAIHLEPELHQEVITQVAEARQRIAQGQFIKNKDILTEFGL